MKRSSTAVWHGSGKAGQGTISAESGAVKNAPYAWNTRFENEKGTNPEELIAAAHAGCFSMKLSFVLGEAGFAPDVIQTTAVISLEKVITGSHLVVKASVPGITEEKFQECAKNAKENCPVSKALASIPVTMEASLVAAEVLEKG